MIKYLTTWLLAEIKESVGRFVGTARRDWKAVILLAALMMLFYLHFVTHWELERWLPANTSGPTSTQSTADPGAEPSSDATVPGAKPNK